MIESEAVVGSKPIARVWYAVCDACGALSEEAISKRALRRWMLKNGWGTRMGYAEIGLVESNTCPEHKDGHWGVEIVDATVEEG